MWKWCYSKYIDELHSWDIQGDQMQGECGVTRSIIDELDSWDIEGGDQMEGESGVTRSTINQLPSSDSQADQKVKVVLLEVSLMNFILSISKEV